MLINEVTIASREQQQSIEQINQTIQDLNTRTQVNAQLAQETYSIAVQSDEIAKETLDDVNKNQFIGKDSIKIDKKELLSRLSIIDKPTPIKQEAKKPTTKIETKTEPKIEPKIIKATKSNDDEWESF